MECGGDLVRAYDFDSSQLLNKLNLGQGVSMGFHDLQFFDVLWIGTSFINTNAMTWDWAARLHAAMHEQ